MKKVYVEVEHPELIKGLLKITVSREPHNPEAHFAMEIPKKVYDKVGGVVLVKVLGEKCNELLKDLEKDFNNEKQRNEKISIME